MPVPTTLIARTRVSRHQALLHAETRGRNSSSRVECHAIKPVTVSSRGQRLITSLIVLNSRVQGRASGAGAALCRSPLNRTEAKPGAGGMGDGVRNLPG